MMTDVVVMLDGEELILSAYTGDELLAQERLRPEKANRRRLLSLFGAETTDPETRWQVGIPASLCTWYWRTLPQGAVAEEEGLIRHALPPATDRQTLFWQRHGAENGSLRLVTICAMKMPSWWRHFSDFSRVEAVPDLCCRVQAKHDGIGIYTGPETALLVAAGPAGVYAALSADDEDGARDLREHLRKAGIYPEGLPPQPLPTAAGVFRGSAASSAPGQRWQKLSRKMKSIVAVYLLLTLAVGGLTFQAQRLESEVVERSQGYGGAETASLEVPSLHVGSLLQYAQKKKAADITFLQIDGDEEGLLFHGQAQNWSVLTTYCQLLEKTPLSGDVQVLSCLRQEEGIAFTLKLVPRGGSDER